MADKTIEHPDPDQGSAQESGEKQTQETAPIQSAAAAGGPLEEAASAAASEPESPRETSAQAPSAAPAWHPAALAFMQVWSASWGDVLGQIAGGRVHCDLSATAPAGVGLTADTDLLMVLAISGPLRGEMSFRISQATAVHLARLLLGDSETEGNDFSPERREAVEELLRQISGHAASALKPYWGELQLRWETAGVPGWAAAATGWLAVRAEAGWSVAVEWHLSAALQAAILNAGVATEGSPPMSAQQPALPDTQEAAPQLLPAEQLGLILDVELALTLRFGAKSLLLQDILQLNAGSVVELDRRVQDPVELLLDGRPIARGEVVVVDGNYGLRVREVFSPSSGA